MEAFKPTTNPSWKGCTLTPANQKGFHPRFYIGDNEGGEERKREKKRKQKLKEKKNSFTPPQDN